MAVGLVDDLREGINMDLAPLTVRQYQQMIRDGILQDGEAIELIQGALLFKNRRDEQGGIKTHGPRHLRAVNKLMALLSRWVANRNAFLQVQGPIVINETSEPEPDCCLVRGTPDDYTDQVPLGADLLIAFEVAFSSLSSDRRTKLRLYAEAQIPFYVIVNLQDNLIEVMSDPVSNDLQYRQHVVYQPQELIQLSLADFGELEFSGRDLI